MVQDAPNAIASTIAPLIVVGIYLLSRRTRIRKRVVIPDFRRGVRFVGGVFSGVLEAGSHSFDPRKEQIAVVDMRPQPMLIERLGFQDALNHRGTISLGAELLVRDPQLAGSALRDQVKDAYLLARDAVRAAMSKQIFSGAADAGLTTTLAAAIRAELAKVGMDISDLEVTEVWSSAPPTPYSTDSIPTVVQ